MGHLITLLSPKKLIVQDGFNRPDNASTMGNANTGQTWQALRGVWGISSNRAYCVSPGGDGAVVVDSGLSNCAVGVNATVVNDNRLDFRMTDADNGLMVTFAPTGYRLYRRQAAAFTQLANTSVIPVNGDTVRVLLNGSSVTVFVNGINIISVTEAYNLTATKHGLGHYAADPSRWDAFIVEAL